MNKLEKIYTAVARSPPPHFFGRITITEHLAKEGIRMYLTILCEDIKCVNTKKNTLRTKLEYLRFQ